MVDARDEQLQELNQTHKQVITNLEQRILQKEERIRNLEQEKEQQQQVSHSEHKVPHASRVTQKVGTGIIKLRWTKGRERAKSYLSGGSSAAGTSIAYFSPRNSQEICAYNSDDQTWTALPSLPYPQFTLAVVNNLLTGIGGWCGSPTNLLLSFIGRGTNKTWTKYFPPMPTKRWDAAAACTEKELIVAGGGDDQAGYLTTVEIMNTDTHQWFTADSLPHSLDYASLVVCEDHIYSLGGENYSTQEPSQLVWRCSLAELNETSRPVMTTQSVTQTVVARLKIAFGFHHDVPAVEMPMPDESKENMKRTLWQSTAKTSLFYSAYASVGGQLLAIGGTTEVNTNMSGQINHGIRTYSADVFA